MFPIPYAKDSHLWVLHSLEEWDHFPDELQVNSSRCSSFAPWLTTWSLQYPTFKTFVWCFKASIHLHVWIFQFFLPRSLYAANISANPEWWLRTLPSFHSLLDFLLWSSFVATHFLSRGDIVSHFAGFSKLGEQWRLVHAQTIIGFESFYSNFLALHLEDEIHLQISPFLKIEDTAIGAHLVNEKLGLESLCHCSSSSCPQNFIISFVGAQSHIWLHFAAFKPTACGFVMLHTLVLNAPAMFRCSSKS